MTRERRNAGEHALPTPHDRNRRDMFAAAALQGLVASAVTDDWRTAEVAEAAVQYADALIEELDKEPSK